MALYMYQAAYTAESIAAQIKEPQDRQPGGLGIPDRSAGGEGHRHAGSDRAGMG